MVAKFQLYKNYIKIKDIFTTYFLWFFQKYGRLISRGKAKMTIRCGIALCVILAMAAGKIKEDKCRKAW